MPTIGELFRAEKIAWQGRTLVLTRASFATEAAFRDYLEKEALAAVNRNAHLLTPAGLKLQMAAWQESCALHVYDFGTEAWAKAMDCPQHRARWFFLVFNQRGIDGKPVGDAVTIEEVEGDPDSPAAACVWRDCGDDIAAAWARLMMPPAAPGGATDPQTPPVAAPGA